MTAEQERNELAGALRRFLTWYEAHHEEKSADYYFASDTLDCYEIRRMRESASKNATVGDVLREIHARRARQPRRSLLARAAGVRL